MIIGKYSLKNIYERYNDPHQRDTLKDEWTILVLYFVVWVSALLVLIYYWSQLELWARILGLVGLLTIAEGPIITLLAVWLGKTVSIDDIPEIPTLTRSDD